MRHRVGGRNHTFQRGIVFLLREGVVFHAEETFVTPMVAAALPVRPYVTSVHLSVTHVECKGYEKIEILDQYLALCRKQEIRSVELGVCPMQLFSYLIT